ncbi:hypothetical protein ACSJLZ_003251 [Serratia bockelmannii]|uniref:hypothetical protein n=1 Tax=Serratia bockelmannii TaxID=2703793 RepID=UPI003F6B2C3F
MNLDAKTLKQLQQQRARLIASGELSEPRLLSDSIDMDGVAKRMKNTVKKKAKPKFVVV